MRAAYLFQYVGGLGGPDEWLGMFVVVVDVLADGFDEFLALPKMPRRSRFSVRSRNNRSTIFSHEQLVGVKCMWKRG